MTKIKTLQETIINYLKEIGADELCNPEADCACLIEDLAPCDCIDLQNCILAKKKFCANSPERNNCSLIKEYKNITYYLVPLENKKE